MKDSYINSIYNALIIKHIAVLVTVDTQLIFLMDIRDKDFKDSLYNMLWQPPKNTRDFRQSYNKV